MNTEQKRVSLFLLGCIPMRLLLVYLAYRQTYMPYFAMIALLISIGFMSIYLFGLRPTGRETFGQPIWWNDLRPVHAALYAVFAYCAIHPVYAKHAWLVLFTDVIIGLIAFLNHHNTV